MTIPTIELVLKTEKPLDFDNSVGLRGFVGRNFSGDVFLHNHDDDNLVYSYPRIQYKIINSRACIIGLAEGVNSIKNIPPIENIVLGHEDVKVNGIDLSERQSTFGVLDAQKNYSFLTPWLALNEKNYDIYRGFGSWEKKKNLLEKILIGNIISISKSLGYTVPEPIKIKILQLKEVPAALKSVYMIGFLGTFSVNFEIPDYWGIGKSVSRGFGALLGWKNLLMKINAKVSKYDNYSA